MSAFKYFVGVMFRLAGVDVKVNPSAVNFIAGSVLNVAENGDNVDVTIPSNAAGFQPLDADLTALASLTATTDSFMQAKASAWAARTITQVRADLIDGYSQPLDTDLTTIASLTATTDNVMMSVNSAWASRTPAQLKDVLAYKTPIIIPCQNAGGSAPNTTTYITVTTGVSAGVTSETTAGFLMLKAGTIKNLSVYLTGNAFIDSYVVTARINGSDTTLVVNAVINAVTTDSTHSVAVNSGDRLTFKVVSGGNGGFTPSIQAVNLDFLIS